MHGLPYWRLRVLLLLLRLHWRLFAPLRALPAVPEFSAWDIGLPDVPDAAHAGFRPQPVGLARRPQRASGAHRPTRLLLSLLGFTAFFWLDRLPGMLGAMAVLAFFWSAALPLVEALDFLSNHLREEGRATAVSACGDPTSKISLPSGGRRFSTMFTAGILWICWGVLAGIVVRPAGGAGRGPSSGRRRGAGDPAGTRVRGPLRQRLAMSGGPRRLYVFYSIHLANLGYSRTKWASRGPLGVVAEIGIFHRHAASDEALRQ